MFCRPLGASRRSASGRRPKSASLFCVVAALISTVLLYSASFRLPQRRARFAQVTWSGEAPAAGSAVVTSPDGRANYYLSRGPVVYLIEVEAHRVHRAWVWRLEDAESLRVRRPPVVTDKTIEVRDLYGDRVTFERASGRVLSVARQS